MHLNAYTHVNTYKYKMCCHFTIPEFNINTHRLSDKIALYDFFCEDLKSDCKKPTKKQKKIK